VLTDPAWHGDASSNFTQSSSRAKANSPRSTFRVRQPVEAAISEQLTNSGRFAGPARPTLRGIRARAEPDEHHSMTAGGGALLTDQTARGLRS